MLQRRDYSIPYLIMFDLFQSDDEDRPQGTDASFVMMSQNQSELLPRLAKAEIHQRQGCTDDALIGHICYGNKEPSHSNRMEMDNDDLESTLPGGFICEGCVPLQQRTNSLFARLSARKEIPEAHFQFMQNHHGKAESFRSE